MIENEMTVSVPLEVVKASEIEPKEVKWLWYPYIPFGKKNDRSVSRLEETSVVWKDNHFHYTHDLMTS